MSKMKINRAIYSYLYDDLDILSKFNFSYSENTLYTPFRNSHTQLGENGQELYTIEMEPSIQIKKIGKFHQVDVDQRVNTLSIGIDASSIPSKCLSRGNTRYLLVKPYIVCASGENAEFILEEISQRVKYLILISDKLNLLYTKCKDALYPHYQLQSNLQNTLKHVKEGKIFADFIEQVIQIAIDYGYSYNSKSKNNENIIIYKDGSILSNSEYKLSHALYRNKFKGLEPFLKLYNSIKKAGENGIPIIGIVKDSHSLLLSKFFMPYGSDYHIVKNLAKRQNINYAYLSPVKKKMKPNNIIEIYNYFTFLEKGISPLRLEVLPNFVPKKIDNISELIEKTIQIIHKNNYIHEFNNAKYKLPYCILHSDLSSRNIAKECKTMINEKLNQIRRRLPIPMIIKQGFE